MLKLLCSFVFALVALLPALGWLSCGQSGPEPLSEHRRLAGELETALKDQLLDQWYPRCIDTVFGGYFSDFNYRWELEGEQKKMIVTQARHLWSLSQVAEFYPDQGMYKVWADHGFRFLSTVMWDSIYGGFIQLVDRTGRSEVAGSGLEPLKTAYGNAFGIYALAAYYHAFHREEALRLAQRAFAWLDQHSYDPVHGGYFQFLTSNGSPHQEGFGQTPPKDQNSSIHLLEAFAELYRVWPDDTLGVRLQHLLHLIRDTIVTERGYMNLFFSKEWQPLSYRDSSAEARKANIYLDHVSFGHDVETAFLLLEAEQILHGSYSEMTLKKAKLMVDHALYNGWDAGVGGFYDQGYYFKDQEALTVINDHKVWWAQAEALNTLLMMSRLFPDDERNYYEKFKIQWEYCKTYLIDPEFGGWYWAGLDKEPERKRSPKGQVWKGNYHVVRSLLRCIKSLSGTEDESGRPY